LFIVLIFQAFLGISCTIALIRIIIDNRTLSFFHTMKKGVMEINIVHNFPVFSADY